ncbi:DNA/RNA nuclease SfsA [Thalassotalea fusca]
MPITLQLQSATLLKRYKRFLADVTFENGETSTIHCANTGAMTGCAASQSTIWYSTSSNTKRKYPHSWEFTQTSDNHLICINTIRANQLAEQAILDDKIKELKNVQQLKREVKYGNENSKVDFWLVDENANETYVEVKSVTLLENQQGYFPDTVTTRGQKHLRELMEIAQQGKRAVLLFAVLHTGINSVSAAAHLDPTYSELLIQAAKAGVEVIAYKMACTDIRTEQAGKISEIALNSKIDVIING